MTSSVQDISSYNHVSLTFFHERCDLVRYACVSSSYKWPKVLFSELVRLGNYVDMDVRGKLPFYVEARGKFPF